MSRQVRSSGRCSSCGAILEASQLEADHVVGVSNIAQALEPANVQALCRPCHYRRKALI
jgi:5-methylcytosine-specific restriction endonuclease McrA